MSVLKYTGPTDGLVSPAYNNIKYEQNVGSAGLATVPPKVVIDAGYPDGIVEPSGYR